MFLIPQSWMPLVSPGDHPPWQVLPHFVTIGFLPVVFHLFLCSSMSGSKMGNILPAELAKKLEGTAEGLSWQPASIYFVFIQQGQSCSLRFFPRVWWSLEQTTPPVALVGVTRHLSCSSVPLFPTRPMASLHNLALSSDLYGCGANKNVPTFLAKLPAVFVQISAGH